jgi:hypothetical protein
VYSGCISIAVTVLALPAAAAAPAVSAASKECACVPGQATAASYTWDFKGEADTIFKDIQFEAQQSVYDADALDSAARAGLTWYSQGGYLDNLKTDIDNIGMKLCRLETIRSVVAPWQQRAIDRIAASTVLMADNTEDAMNFGNVHQRELWLATYRNYVNNLFDEAQKLKQSTGRAVEFASVSKKYREEVKSL